jgi:hypothetical protein
MYQMCSQWHLLKGRMSACKCSIYSVVITHFGFSTYLSTSFKHTHYWKTVTFPPSKMRQHCSLEIPTFIIRCCRLVIETVAEGQKYWLNVTLFVVSCLCCIKKWYDRLAMCETSLKIGAACWFSCYSRWCYIMDISYWLNFGLWMVFS